MEQVIKDLKDQRVRLDTHKTAIGKLPRSRGQALAYTSLEKGRMYIGEVCRELGVQYPYEATKTATTAEGIQDAVDVSDKAYEVDANEIVAINNLREVLEKELEVFMSTIFPTVGSSTFRLNKDLSGKFTLDCSISEAYRSLKESRMWLGIRLGELRDTVK